MYASKITRAVLELAADEVGVAVEIETLNAAGTRHRVKVNPKVPTECYTPSGYRRKGEKGNAPYQRISVGPFNGGRRVHAVCWHGFRDFFRACFTYAPDAVFRTAMDTWKGSEDFEHRFRDSGYRNVGAPIMPISACEACECPESGMAC